MTSDSKLDFAYKYPFSQEAKEIVADLNRGSVDEQYLREGVSRLTVAMKEGRVPYEKVMEVTDLKRRRIMSYVYARMLVSAIGDSYSISRFAAAEASTATEILSLDSADNLIKLANELDMGIKKENGGFVLSFEKFVSVPKKDDIFKLVNQRLANGLVHLDEVQALHIVGGMIEKEIGSRLPVEKKDLPREVIEAARGIKGPETKISSDARKGAYSWIEKLLATPIPDVRHRSVNLIFAPYLVNVKNVDPEIAAKTIIEYIERCKKVNPNTKINDSYIKYQCRYAKAKGLRPLSLTRAKEMLREVAQFE